MMKMNILVRIEHGQPVTDSLIVAEVFGKNHADVLRDTSNQINKLNEAGEQVWSLRNFAESDYTNERGRKYPKFNLTEEAFAIIAMSYVTPVAMKMKVRFLEEFKRMRQQLTAPQIPQSLSEALFLAATLAEEKEALQLQAAADRPKVIFAEALEVSDDSILVGELAKLLKQNGINIGEVRLFKWLRQNGYLVKTGSEYNMPTQRSMELKIMEIKVGQRLSTSDGFKATRTTKITGKGQIYFINKFKASGEFKSLVTGGAPL
jgi:anti-repressor protein